METLKELSGLIYYKMENYNQITIDLVEDVESIFNDIETDINTCDLNQLFTIKNNLGSISYDAENILQIINPELKHDVEALSLLKNIIAEKIAIVEDRINTLKNENPS